MISSINRILRPSVLYNSKPAERRFCPSIRHLVERSFFPGELIFARFIIEELDSVVVSIGELDSVVVSIDELDSVIVSNGETDSVVDSTDGFDSVVVKVDLQVFFFTPRNTF